MNGQKLYSKKALTISYSPEKRDYLLKISTEQFYFNQNDFLKICKIEPTRDFSYDITKKHKNLSQILLEEGINIKDLKNFFKGAYKHFFPNENKPNNL